VIVVAIILVVEIVLTIDVVVDVVLVAYTNICANATLGSIY